jgi:hypothetical protein
VQSHGDNTINVMKLINDIPMSRAISLVIAVRAERPAARLGEVKDMGGFAAADRRTRVGAARGGTY